MNRILVVDDAKDINTLICTTLRNNKFDPVPAYDGEEACQILSTDKNFSIVITDVIMPHRDGLDLINFIEENNIHIPIIGMSGGGQVISGDIALKSIEQKTIAVLKKPFKPDILLKHINDILKQNKLA